jgi:hypothetical protein
LNGRTFLFRRANRGRTVADTIGEVDIVAKTDPISIVCTGTSAAAKLRSFIEHVAETC